MSVKPPSQLHRSSILVMFALLQIGGDGATYVGLQSLLGQKGVKGTKKAVLSARQDGIVEIHSSGIGPGAKAVIRLTPAAQALARKLLHG